MSDTYQAPTTFSILPPVIKNLLIINVLIYLAQYVLAARFGNPFFGPVEQWFALWPLGTPARVPTEIGVLDWPRFFPWQVVTMAFLHGSIGHLVFNMFALWMFGMRIENVMGTRRFTVFYFVCVIGASLAQLAVTSGPALLGIGAGSLFPTLGASGGVLGVLAAFGLLFPKDKIYIFPLPFPVEARWLVLGYAALDLFAGVTGSQAGVANFAHLGGLITGGLLVQYWRGKLPFKPARYSA